MISATIVADSINEFNNRLITLSITLPRYILAELNTHRILSKNSASSRAIPFNRLVKSVQENPFIPMAWQKEHKGMQGFEYFNSYDRAELDSIWLTDKYYAIKYAMELNEKKGTKQLINRLLEPFMWHTVLISGTEWSNFFELRCPQYEITHGKFNGTYRSIKDAVKDLSRIADILQDMSYDEKAQEISELSILDRLKLNKGMADIHMMFLAEAIWDAINESTPKQLKAGEWHIPYEDKIRPGVVAYATEYDMGKKYNSSEEAINMYKVKISTGMCARASYTVVGDEKEVSYETLIGIHDKMKIQVPFHASPFEHCAPAMSREDMDNFIRMENGVVEEGWCRNFKGFIQYRYIIENNISK